MIATFQVNLGLFIDAFINDGIQRIACADRGNGPEGTVLKQLSDFIFRGQADILTKLCSQLRKLDVVRRRKNREQIAAIAA